MHATLINCSLALTSCWCLVSALALIEKIPVNRSCTQFGFCSMMPAASTSLTIALVPDLSNSIGSNKVGTRLDMTCHQYMAAVPVEVDSVGIILRIRPHFITVIRWAMEYSLYLRSSVIMGKLSPIQMPMQSKVSIKYLTPKLYLCLSVSVSPLELVSVLQKKSSDLKEY